FHCNQYFCYESAFTIPEGLETGAKPVMPLPDLHTLRTHFTDLSQLALIAQGGQKAVYEAQHIQHGHVVLKIILDSSDVERTEREVEVATRCQFANVPRLISHGTFQVAGDDNLYII